MLSVKSREAVNTNFTVLGLTGLGSKPESTAPEADAISLSHLSCINMGSLICIHANTGVYARSFEVGAQTNPHVRHNECEVKRKKKLSCSNF